MKRPRNMAEMRRSYEGACIMRKRTSKPQAKRPRGTTPSMKVHALATPNMESSAHEVMSGPPKARCPPKKKPAHSDAKTRGYAIKHRTIERQRPPCHNAHKLALPPPKPNGSPVRNHHPKPKSRLAALCHKPAFCISNKLERTRRSARPQQPRARRRWRPTVSRQWHVASLPQSPLSGHACPRQPAQASR